MATAFALKSADPAPILPARSLALLSDSYPSQAARLGHGLAGHPLLTLEALACAAERMDPRLVECRRSKNANGEGFDSAEPVDGGVAATIRGIATAGRWVMLRFAESLPEYAELLDRMLGEIAPVIARHGPALSPRAFIFISSPGTLTPFHFDPEFNILFQIAGSKRFATCPASEPWLSPDQQLRFHSDGDNLLPWHPDLIAGAQVHALAPGEGLFVPYKAPHWVEVGGSPSISLSLTWSNSTSLELEAAWQFNAWLARVGAKPQPPAAFPGRARVKAALRRSVGKLGLA